MNDKDIKILWSRAAGLCSMPDCRKKLTLDNISETVSMTLGEMCHIVGEKDSDKSPRGISKLPVEDRNYYSNLILLCAHHHTVIDKNEDDWPVEILHKIKDDHELWVEDTLTAKILTPEELVYTALVNGIDSSLKLDSWNWFIPNAVRYLLHKDFLESLDYVNERRLAVAWPEKKLELEKSMKDVLAAFEDYGSHFLSLADMSHPEEFLRRDTRYKQIYPNPHYDDYNQQGMLWMQKSYLLLCRYTFFVNQFAIAVRKYLDPMFYITKGHFLIIDELGMSNSYLMLPEINEIEPRLTEINEKILAFEAEKGEFF